ncbi:hypothetical protein FDA48_01490 [Clostridium botulinum]|nr:hypothetical protein [Clostridium botulinum]
MFFAENEVLEKQGFKIKIGNAFFRLGCAHFSDKSIKKVWIILINTIIIIVITIKREGVNLKFSLYSISEELLDKLSFESKLGKSLKNTLRKFQKDDLFNEIIDLKEFYESNDLLKGVLRSCK